MRTIQPPLTGEAAVFGRGARSDLPYSNIRHLFYQPCKTKEVITILHVHLKNPIMVNNKKTKVCRLRASSEGCESQA